MVMVFLLGKQSPLPPQKAGILLSLNLSLRRPSPFFSYYYAPSCHLRAVDKSSSILYIIHHFLSFESINLWQKSCVFLPNEFYQTGKLPIDIYYNIIYNDYMKNNLDQLKEYLTKSVRDHEDYICNIISRYELRKSVKNEYGDIEYAEEELLDIAAMNCEEDFSADELCEQDWFQNLVKRSAACNYHEQS